MAEAAPAKFGAPQTDTIQITFAANQYGVVPVTSSVANNGQVSFVCTRACWIWTIVSGALANAFVGETNHYLVCAPGNNGPFTPAVSNTTITVVPLPVNSNPPPPQDAKDVLRGTITVSSMGEPKEGEYSR